MMGYTIFYHVLLYPIIPIKLLCIGIMGYSGQIMIASEITMSGDLEVSQYETEPGILLE